MTNIFFKQNFFLYILFVLSSVNIINEWHNPYFIVQFILISAVLFFRIYTSFKKPSTYCMNIVDTVDAFSLGAPDVAYYIDPEFKCLSINKNLCKIFNIKNKKDVIGKNIYSFMPEKEADLLVKYGSQSIREKSSISFIMETTYENKKIVFELVISPVYEKNKLAGLFLTGRDITEQEVIRHQNETTKKQIASILDNVSIAAYLKDTDGNIIMGNRDTFNYFGFEYNEENKKKLSETYKKHFYMMAYAEDRHIIEHKEPIIYKKKIFTPNKKHEWHRVVKYPTFNEHNEVNGIAVFLENIHSEIEASNAKDSYIATLSHDLKTPTIAQIRSLELLLDGEFGPLNEKQAEIVSLTLESCRYMLNMVLTLLTTYKFENGEVYLNPEEFNLLEATTEVCNELNSLSSEKKLNIVVNVKADDCVINVDKIHMKRVITNLISNSISYAYENSDIIIKIVQKNDFYEYSVINKGPYITKSKMEELFEKYTQQRSKFNKVGFGLGLYLSKQIIEAHHGTVIAKSCKKNVNTFGFSIHKNIFSKNGEYKLVQFN